ncbi:flavin reductase like domain-containing protein [Trichophaea hybrida]|nr:flavin reductase like domain-containing protein [Trichophaea hybrida]
MSIPRIRTYLLNHHIPQRKLISPHRPKAFFFLPILHNWHNSSASHTPAPSPPPSPPVLSPISESLRTSMRALPHPVVILTTAAVVPPTSTGHGITLSTLTCVSLHPHALITFNIKTPSKTSRSMHKHGSFCIHVLHTTPHSAHIANVFAQLAASHNRKLSPWTQLRGQIERDPDTGVPMLGLEDGVISRWRCERYQVVEVEDHEIWVGRVVQIDDLTGGKSEGLMYQNRRFRRVGDEVVAELTKLGEEVNVDQQEEVNVDQEEEKAKEAV